MQIESVSETAELLGKQVPGLSDTSLELVQLLKTARVFLDKLFEVCMKKGYEIELTPDEQNEISMKVAMIVNPEMAIQYAKLVQLVFQLNYYSGCYKNALKLKLPKMTRKEAKLILKEIEKFRKLIEKEYIG